MPAKCAANLLTFGPVVAVHFEVRPTSEGVELYVQHRHWATSFFECEQEKYSALTFGECLDVVGANLWQYLEGNADSR